MTEPLFECVPNVSEGRQASVIEALTRAITSVTDEALLDSHSDVAHNRTVFTLAGEGHALVEAIARLAAVAVEWIDLAQQQGGHPRIGALDVVPFVPLEGATMEQAVTLANVCGRRLAEELTLPVYFYGEAAFRPENQQLPDIRGAGTSGLGSGAAGRAPDVGPSELHPTAGATVVGAREPLVAYNVNLATDDVEIAQRVARTIRTSDGGFPAVRALGVALEEEGLAQVSMNLIDTARTGMMTVTTAVEILAKEQGTDIHDGEIVGLIPTAAWNEELLDRLPLRDFDLDNKLLERRLQAVGLGRGAACATR